VSFGPVANSSLNACGLGPSLVFVQPALACIGRRWPLVAFVWPVRAETGGLYVVGVEMRRWGVETRGWEPNTWLRVGGSTIEKKHEKLEKKHENLKKKHEKFKKKHTYGPNDASGVVWARCCCRHTPKPHCAFKT
jgi:hypothetical protein